MEHIEHTDEALYMSEMQVRNQSGIIKAKIEQAYYHDASYAEGLRTRDSTMYVRINKVKLSRERFEEHLSELQDQLHNLQLKQNSNMRFMDYWQCYQAFIKSGKAEKAYEEYYRFINTLNTECKEVYPEHIEILSQEDFIHRYFKYETSSLLNHNLTLLRIETIDHTNESLALLLSTVKRCYPRLRH